MSFSKKYSIAIWLLLAPYAYGTPILSKGCDQLFTDHEIIRPLPQETLPSQLTEQELTPYVSEKIPSVPEFKAIREFAQLLGIRVWLFGGTASSFIHYVKWDLATQKGLLDFQKDRFDYDFTHIFRSTQDIDLVVDSSPEIAEKFRLQISEKFPHFLGHRLNEWEVRTLRYPIGKPGESHYKEALLHDPNFRNQNTDSHSLGMIEITHPDHDPIIRDLRNWDQEKSVFLNDVILNQVRFFKSKNHFTTTRAERGENPEILSVIRILVKAFQFRLKIPPSDFYQLKTLVDEFDPKKIENPTALRRINDTAIKLILHASDLEYAINTLDQLGLRAKLIEMGNPNDVETTAWWLNREPLRSKPIGRGHGRTARELKLEYVTHETNSFSAYESITRSHSGKPNVLISRVNVQTERALYGSGFYTLIGRQGFFGNTGINIRFKVHPDAREGSDFTLNMDAFDEYKLIVFKNKNALEILPENLDMSAIEYFKFLASGNQFSKHDQALLWKFRRKIQNRFTSSLFSQYEVQNLENFILNEIKTQSPQILTIFHEWLKLRGPRFEKEIDHYTQYSNGAFFANPATWLKILLLISRDSLLESWVRNQHLPALLTSIKSDIGDRALQNCVFSEFIEIREFGQTILKTALENRPTPFLRALSEIEKQKKPEENDFTQAIQRWLAYSPETPTLSLIEEKASWIAHQPSSTDELKWIPKDQIGVVLQRLTDHSNFFIFKNLLENQNEFPQKLFLSQASPESFQFISFEIPKNWITFEIGSPNTEPGRSQNEDIRYVTLSESFQIQATPLTEYQRALLLGKSISNLKSTGNQPATRLSWEDAHKIAEILSQLDPDYIYRLPTEIEWEYAARAGTKTSYFFGSNVEDLPEYAIFNKNSGGKVKDVATRKPNPAGLYDVHGNVWEWCEDLAENGYLRKMKGGSWTEDANSVRSARRYGAIPSIQPLVAGVRFVRIRRF